MDPQFVERRRYPRAKIEWPVTVKTDQGIISGYTLNLSAGGATVRLQNPPLVHEIIEMTIKIPELDRNLAVKAEVVWSTADIVDNELTLPNHWPQFHRHQRSRPLANLYRSRQGPQI